MYSLRRENGERKCNTFKYGFRLFIHEYGLTCLKINVNREINYEIFKGVSKGSNLTFAGYYKHSQRANVCNC